MDRHHMQPRRHHLLQVLKHLGPGESFALESSRSEIAERSRTAPIFRTVEQRLRILLFPFAVGNLLFPFANQDSIAGRGVPSCGALYTRTSVRMNKPAKAPPQRSQKLPGSS